MDQQRFTLWKSGYRVSHALAVELVAETDKAYKFKEMDSGKDYTFFMPKKACNFDKTNDGLINVAVWFTVEGFLSYLFQRYASHYNR